MSGVIGSGAGDMTLEIRDIGKSFRPAGLGRSPLRVLDNVHLSMGAGEVIGITGDSGAGKTTLGLILAGILRPDRGKVRVAGTDLWAVSKSARKKIGRILQMVFQHPESTFNPRWTMRQSLSEAFRFGRIPLNLSKLNHLVGSVELDASILDRRPSQLSGGELQRIAIARIMVLHPGFVVLDEPTAMLDVLTQARIMNLLARIRGETGVGYILISHDAALVGQFCHRVYRLEHGRLASS
jgi:peptide/nickel transport system ATP-binding protein